MSSCCLLLKHIVENSYKMSRITVLSIIISVMYLPSLFTHFELRSIAIFWETKWFEVFSSLPVSFKLRFRGGVLTESLRRLAPFGTLRCLFWFSRFFPSARVVNIKSTYTPSPLKRSVFSSGDTEETSLQNRVQAKIKKSLRSSGSIVQKCVK